MYDLADLRVRDECNIIEFADKGHECSIEICVCAYQ